MSKVSIGQWRDHRYIVAENYMFDGPGHLVVLTDLAYWAEHGRELADWCEQHGLAAQGVTVPIPTDELLMLFSLRWS